MDEDDLQKMLEQQAIRNEPLTYHHWKISDKITTTGVRVGEGAHIGEEPWGGPLQIKGTCATTSPPSEDHQAHLDSHQSVIDNYEAYKMIEVLTELLDEVRKINNKICKPKKKKKVKK